MGALVHQGIPFLTILERPWLFNKPNESCAPAGTYICKRYISQKYPAEKLAWIIQNVPGRTNMLIHAGNTIKDSKGCTLPGIGFGELEGEPAVISSREALRKLNEVTGGEDFELVIHGN